MPTVVAVPFEQAFDVVVVVAVDVVVVVPFPENEVVVPLPYSWEVVKKLDEELLVVMYDPL